MPPLISLNYSLIDMMKQNLILVTQEENHCLVTTEGWIWALSETGSDLNYLNHQHRV